MAKRHWRDWNYKGVAKLTTEDGSENVTRGVRERDGTDSNGQAAIELKEVALEAEHPKITLQQVCAQTIFDYLPWESRVTRDSNLFSSVSL